VNLRRLKYFVRIVDAGSLGQASQLLHIAQPALSQQLFILEREFGLPLLIRNKRGVTPTEAGRTLYTHAQVILRQFEQAQSDVKCSGKLLSGKVSIGLPPGIATTLLPLPLLKKAREEHPLITLHLNENLGTTLLDLVLTGRMDMAVLYGAPPVYGIRSKHLLDEALFVVIPASEPLTNHATGGAMPLAKLRDVNLILPRPYNCLRRYLDEAFANSGVTPRIVAEMESAVTLTAAIQAGLGATILPYSAAQAVSASSHGKLFRLTNPSVDVPLALCESDHLRTSEPAAAIRDLLLELTMNIATSAASTSSLSEMA